MVMQGTMGNVGYMQNGVFMWESDEDCPICNFYWKNFAEPLGRVNTIKSENKKVRGCCKVGLGVGKGIQGASENVCSL